MRYLFPFAKLLFCFSLSGFAAEALPRPCYRPRPGDLLRYTLMPKEEPHQPLLVWDLFCTATNVTPARASARWVYRLRIEPFEGAAPPMPPRIYEEGGRLEVASDGSIIQQQGAFLHAEPDVLFPILPSELSETKPSWTAVRGQTVLHGRIQHLPDTQDPELRFIQAHTRQHGLMPRVAIKMEYRFDVSQGRLLGGLMEVVDTRRPDRRATYVLTLDPGFRVTDGDFAILMRDEKTVFIALNSYEQLMQRVADGGPNKAATAAQAQRVLDAAIQQTDTIFLRNELIKRQDRHKERVNQQKYTLP